MTLTLLRPSELEVFTRFGNNKQFAKCCNAALVVFEIVSRIGCTSRLVKFVPVIDGDYPVGFRPHLYSLFACLEKSMFILKTPFESSWS